MMLKRLVNRTARLVPSWCTGGTPSVRWGWEAPSSETGLASVAPPHTDCIDSIYLAYSDPSVPTYAVSSTPSDVALSGGQHGTQESRKPEPNYDPQINERETHFPQYATSNHKEVVSSSPAVSSDDAVQRTQAAYREGITTNKTPQLPNKQQVYGQQERLPRARHSATTLKQPVSYQPRQRPQTTQQPQIYGKPEALQRSRHPSNASQHPISYQEAQRSRPTQQQLQQHNPKLVHHQPSQDFGHPIVTPLPSRLDFHGKPTYTNQMPTPPMPPPNTAAQPPLKLQSYNIRTMTSSNIQTQKRPNLNLKTKTQQPTRQVYSYYRKPSLSSNLESKYLRPTKREESITTVTCSNPEIQSRYPTRGTHFNNSSFHSQQLTQKNPPSLDSRACLQSGNVIHLPPSQCKPAGSTYCSISMNSSSALPVNAASRGHVGFVSNDSSLVHPRNATLQQLPNPTSFFSTSDQLLVQVPKSPTLHGLRNKHVFPTSCKAPNVRGGQCVREQVTSGSVAVIFPGKTPDTRQGQLGDAARSANNKVQGATNLKASNVPLCCKSTKIHQDHQTSNLSRQKQTSFGTNAPIKQLKEAVMRPARIDSARVSTSTTKGRAEFLNKSVVNATDATVAREESFLLQKYAKNNGLARLEVGQHQGLTTTYSSKALHSGASSTSSGPSSSSHFEIWDAPTKSDIEEREFLEIVKNTGTLQHEARENKKREAALYSVETPTWSQTDSQISFSDNYQSGSMEKSADISSSTLSSPFSALKHLPPPKIVCNSLTKQAYASSTSASLSVNEGETLTFRPSTGYVDFSVKSEQQQSYMIKEYEQKAALVKKPDSFATSSSASSTEAAPAFLNIVDSTQDHVPDQKSALRLFENVAPVEKHVGKNVSRAGTRVPYLTSHLGAQGNARMQAQKDEEGLVYVSIRFRAPVIDLPPLPLVRKQDDIVQNRVSSPNAPSQQSAVPRGPTCLQNEKNTTASLRKLDDTAQHCVDPSKPASEESAVLTQQNSFKSERNAMKASPRKQGETAVQHHHVSSLNPASQKFDVPEKRTPQDKQSTIKPPLSQGVLEKRHKDVLSINDSPLKKTASLGFLPNKSKSSVLSGNKAQSTPSMINPSSHLRLHAKRVPQASSSSLRESEGALECQQRLKAITSRAFSPFNLRGNLGGFKAPPLRRNFNDCNTLPLLSHSGDLEPPPLSRQLFQKANDGNSGCKPPHPPHFIQASRLMRQAASSATVDSKISNTEIQHKTARRSLQRPSRASSPGSLTCPVLRQEYALARAKPNRTVTICMQPKTELCGTAPTKPLQRSSPMPSMHNNRSIVVKGGFCKSSKDSAFLKTSTLATPRISGGSLTSNTGQQTPAKFLFEKKDVSPVQKILSQPSSASTAYQKAKSISLSSTSIAFCDRPHLTIRKEKVDDVIVSSSSDGNVQSTTAPRMPVKEQSGCKIQTRPTNNVYHVPIIPHEENDVLQETHELRGLPKLRSNSQFLTGYALPEKKLLSASSLTESLPPTKPLSTDGLSACGKEKSLCQLVSSLASSRPNPYSLPASFTPHTLTAGSTRDDRSLSPVILITDDFDYISNSQSDRTDSQITRYSTEPHPLMDLLSHTAHVENPQERDSRASPCFTINCHTAVSNIPTPSLRLLSSPLIVDGDKDTTDFSRTSSSWIAPESTVGPTQCSNLPLLESALLSDRTTNHSECTRDSLDSSTSRTNRVNTAVVSHVQSSIPAVNPFEYYSESENASVTYSVTNSKKIHPFFKLNHKALHVGQPSVLTSEANGSPLTHTPNDTQVEDQSVLTASQVSSQATFSNRTASCRQEATRLPSLVCLETIENSSTSTLLMTSTTERKTLTLTEEQQYLDSVYPPPCSALVEYQHPFLKSQQRNLGKIPDRRGPLKLPLFVVEESSASSEKSSYNSPVASNASIDLDQSSSWDDTLFNLKSTTTKITQLSARGKQFPMTRNEILRLMIKHRAYGDPLPDGVEELYRDHVHHRHSWDMFSYIDGRSQCSQSDCSCDCCSRASCSYRVSYRGNAPAPFGGNSPIQHFSMERQKSTTNGEPSFYSLATGCPQKPCSLLPSEAYTLSSVPLASSPLTSNIFGETTELVSNAGSIMCVTCTSCSTESSAHTSNNQDFNDAHPLQPKVFCLIPTQQGRFLSVHTSHFPPPPNNSHSLDESQCFRPAVEAPTFKRRVSTRHVKRVKPKQHEPLSFEYCNKTYFGPIKETITSATEYVYRNGSTVINRLLNSCYQSMMTQKKSDVPQSSDHVVLAGNGSIAESEC